MTLHTDMRRQNALIENLEIVEESDFSDTIYNSAYVSDVQFDWKKYFAAIFRVKCLN